MSGLALLMDRHLSISPHDEAWAGFLSAVADFKSLDLPDQFATGVRCLGAKLDSPSALHRGVTCDEATSSWLLAAGTVVDTAVGSTREGLQQLLVDYLERGVEVLARLDGHFALIIYDGREESVAVVSDPFGLVSLFYAQRGDRFFVSTSALAIAHAIQDEPDEFWTRHYVLYGMVLDENTLWQQVKRVPPATIVKNSPGGLTSQSYWSFDFDLEIAQLSLDESVTRIIDVISQSLQNSLADQERVWLSLTGGLDSRTVAVLAHYNRIPFQVYCHGPQDSKDVQIALNISQELGWDFEYFSLPEDWGVQRVRWLPKTLGLTDGHLDVLKRSRIVREQTLKARQHGVSLWGFGGETFRGFNWKLELLRTGNTTRVNYDRFFDYRLTPSSGWQLLQDTPGWRAATRDHLRTQIEAVGERNPDWPNTVKLDLIGQYLEHPYSGAAIAAVMGLQRVLAPFDMKDAVACVLSINHKWRTHSRLFRHMLERICPPLAEFETADGGPAVPIRVTNLHRFLPYWTGETKKLVWGVSRKLLGKSLWQKAAAGTTGKAYPVSRWRRETLVQLEGQGLLQLDRMHSAGLYDPPVLRNFLELAKTDSFAHEGLLSRIITLEMALRAADGLI